MTAGLMIVGVLAVSLQAQAPTAGDPYDAPLLQGCERTVAASPGGYFPVLVRLDGERLGAVLRGGAPHLGIGGRLDWVVSEDGGRTWGGRVVVADSAWDDRNPACHSMPDGTIVVAYQECHTYDDQGRYGKGTTPSRYMVTRSTDGGRTWAEPEPFPTAYGCPFGQMVPLDDGSVLTACYSWHNHIGLMRSEDSGRTWQPHAKLPGCGETALCRDRAGRIFAFIREDLGETALLAPDVEKTERVGHYLRATVSKDGGKTWTEPVTLTHPAQHPGGAEALADGSLLLCYGQRAVPYGVGALHWDSSEALARLLEGGEAPLPSARRVLVAWDCARTDCGYPSPVQLDDGTVVVMYYAYGTLDDPKGERAAVVRFRPEELKRSVEAGEAVRLVVRDDLDQCTPEENLRRWTWRTGLAWAHGGDLLHLRDGTGDEVLGYDPGLTGRYRVHLGTRSVTPAMKVRLRLAGEQEWDLLELPDSEGKDAFAELEWRVADLTGKAIEIAPVAGQPAYLDYFRFTPEATGE